MIFLDTETIGFHGPIVLVQWATESGDVQTDNVWNLPIKYTLDLFELFCAHDVVGFNLVFDWFHIYQMYTVLRLMENKDKLLIDCVKEYAAKEAQGRFGPCLKPKRACDLMLVARRGKYQITMRRKPIRIRKVPTMLAYELADKLQEQLQFSDILFAKSDGPKWSIKDTPNPELKNLELEFKPSGGLKAIVNDALGHQMLEFESIDRRYQPDELGYAPYLDAVKRAVNKKGKPLKRWWTRVLPYHLEHWARERNIQYAEDDTRQTRELYHYFGDPEPGDDDSELACAIAACRWRGYAINIDAINERQAIAHNNRNIVKDVSFASHRVCRAYMQEVMSPTEAAALLVDGKITTKTDVLRQIEGWKRSEVCDDCAGEGCDKCEDGLINYDERHPAAIRAEHILNFRRAGKELEILDKFVLAGRFHASLSVIGTLSSRMSGSDGLNPQGIKHAKYIRACFPLADNGLTLCGGDFSGFEVVLMDAAYGDPELRKDLLTMRQCPKCKGAGCSKCGNTGQEETKIHALFGQYLFSGNTYDSIRATDGLPGDADLYTRSKRGVFGLAYGGNEHTLVRKIGVTEEDAIAAYRRWVSRYKVWGQVRARIFDAFCSMRQPKGPGTRVEWHEPEDYIESMFGFRRYFTVENTTCRSLFHLAENIPEQWERMRVRVTRRDREQTVGGAVRSAIYAAAFSVQASNMRAAANHVIQSSGATLTKKLQRRIWDLQPCGAHEWVVQPLNIHDEIMCPAKSEMIPIIRGRVDDFISEHREKVPLLGIDWRDSLATWANK